MYVDQKLKIKLFLFRNSSSNRLLLSTFVKFLADILSFMSQQELSAFIQKKNHKIEIEENGWVVLKLVFFTLLEARYRSKTLLSQIALMPPSSKWALKIFPPAWSLWRMFSRRRFVPLAAFDLFIQRLGTATLSSLSAGFKNKTNLRAGVRLPWRCQSVASECGHNDPDLLSCSHRGVIHQSPAERRGSVNWLMRDYLWTSARAAWWTVSSVGGCAFVKFTPSPSSPLIWPIWFIQCPLGVLHRVNVIYVDGGENICSIIRRRGLWAKMDYKPWAFENGNRQPGGPAAKPDLFWSPLLKSCYSHMRENAIWKAKNLKKKCPGILFH